MPSLPSFSHRSLCPLVVTDVRGGPTLSRFAAHTRFRPDPSLRRIGGNPVNGHRETTMRIPVARNT